MVLRLSRGASPHAEDAVCGELAQILTQALNGAKVRGWAMKRIGAWYYVAPEGCSLPVQGWKVHISSCPFSAGVILRRVAPLLIAESCAFKCAVDARSVGRLNGPHAPRASSGKFITAYPLSDEQAARVAERVADATADLSGPRILTDLQFRPGSVVHFRYGAFTGIPFLSPAGEEKVGIVAPGGRGTEDLREPGVASPAWAPPCPAAVLRQSQHCAASRGVTLVGRFQAREALRHANKGGVFRATDLKTGRTVVIKQARAHIGEGADGSDVRALLRHEAEMLRVLEPAGIAPGLVAEFELPDNRFLVEEAFSGDTLRVWIRRRYQGVVPSLGSCALRDMAAEVAELVATVHAAGVAIGDLSPGNVVVEREGRLRLIDLEVATAVGASRVTAADGMATPGYASPEQLQGDPPSQMSDLWNLGALLIWIFTAQDPPVLVSDGILTCSARHVQDWLRQPLRRYLIPDVVRALIGRLCADNPSDRPPADAVAKALRAIATTDRPAVTFAALVRLSLASVQAPGFVAEEIAAADLIDELLTQKRLAAGQYIWPTSPMGERMDQRNVQNGTAGHLGVLAQAAKAQVPGLGTAVREIASSLAGQFYEFPGGPVGIHYGAAGLAWAVADAGMALGEDTLVRSAVEFALHQTADWANPDVTHGRAGLGLTLLHLWRDTGDARLLAAADRVAQSLIESVSSDAAGLVSWQLPDDLDGSMSGRRYFGFAHGMAGIGLFLLEHAAETGRRDCWDAVDAATDALEKYAVRACGTAGWGFGPDSTVPAWAHWCHGSSGVGTYLVRVYAKRPTRSLRSLIKECARFVMAMKFRAGPSYCHGLAGDGDFLLDVAGIFGDPRYRAWAHDLAGLLLQRQSSRNGLTVFADDPSTDGADFGFGSSGVLSFLLRLRHGGQRLWLPSASGSHHKEDGRKK